MRILVLSGLVSLLMISNVLSQQLAFPGAEGYGKYTIGGRGAKVIEVSNLNDSGEGSLRAALEASEPRTVVFRISGTIVLDSPIKIKSPFITIAGQTAPGDGICIRKNPIIIAADQVIIRYLRFRLGDESGGDHDALSGRYANNIILDHLSTSWSVDETMSIYHCDSISVQWCIISESMFKSNHVKGSHGFGGIWGSNFGSYHHNLLANHASRTPRFASGSGYVDYRNNVIYNWGYNSCYGGEQKQVGDSKHSSTTINLVANYYKPGPATQSGKVSYRIASPSSRNGAEDYGKWYIADNMVVGNEEVSSDNWDGGVQVRDGNSILAKLKLDKAWPAMSIKQETAEEAFLLVLKNAGAILPKRDLVDMRIIADAQNGQASYEGVAYSQNNSVSANMKSGIIDSQNDVGGWPLLKSTPAPSDSDHDGMPDDWERTQGLNPNNADDRNAIAEGGYTMLEVYLNSLK